MTFQRFLRTLRHLAIFIAILGLAGTAQGVMSKSVISDPAVKASSDFTGDHLTDIVFLTISTSEWTVHDSKGAITSVTTGELKSKPAAADYDGKTDPAVWSPSHLTVRTEGSLDGALVFKTESTTAMLPVSSYFTTK